MKKTILISLLIVGTVDAQPTFKTGINFPFYAPGIVSIDQYLNLMSQSGTKSIRQMTFADVHWKQVEPTNDNWNFTKSDSAFFNNYSLTPIGTLYSMMGNDTIGLQVPWLACNNPFTCYWDPTNDSTFSKDYVMQTVNRYKNKTKYWEVANEIESSLPPEGLVTLVQKRDFLKYNYQWIKQADPNAKVLLPGLVGTCCTYPISNSFTWLRNMLNIGTGSYFDIMNFHDYNAWWTLPAHMDSVKNILSQYNLTKPIWVTETAISSANISPITPSYSSIDEQAADVWRRHCLLWAKGAEVVMWHTGWSNNDMSGWGEFGILNYQGQKKKSFHSYKLLNDEIANFSSVTLLSTGTISNNNNSGGNGIWVIKFVVNGTNKWVMWSPNKLSYTLSGINSSHIKVTNVVPNQLSNNGNSAQFTINTYATSSGLYNFNQLPSLPILVEETTATSLNSYSLEDNIKIYPNPTSGVINIEYKLLNNSEINIEIMNTTGKVVYNQKNKNIYTSGYDCIDLSHFNKGMYLIKFSSENKSIIKKILLK